MHKGKEGQGKQASARGAVSGVEQGGSAAPRVAGGVAVARASQSGRVALVAGLRLRRAEIDAAILARISSIGANPPASVDREYAAGLRAAVLVAVEYTLAGIEAIGDPPLRPPPTAPGRCSRRRVEPRARVSAWTPCCAGMSPDTRC